MEVSSCQARCQLWGKRTACSQRSGYRRTGFYPSLPEGSPSQVRLGVAALIITQTGPAFYLLLNVKQLQEANRKVHTHLYVIFFFSLIGADMHKTNWKSRRPGRRGQRQNPWFRQHGSNERQVLFPGVVLALSSTLTCTCVTGGLIKMQRVRRGPTRESAFLTESQTWPILWKDQDSVHCLYVLKEPWIVLGPGPSHKSTTCSKMWPVQEESQVSFGRVVWKHSGQPPSGLHAD